MLYGTSVMVHVVLKAQGPSCSLRVQVPRYDGIRFQKTTWIKVFGKFCTCACGELDPIGLRAVAG